MTLITGQRYRDEALAWQDVTVELDKPWTDPETGVVQTHAIAYRIIDSDGVTYDGIIHDDGKVETDAGYMTFDSVEICEGFRGATDSGIYKRFGIAGRATHRIFVNETTEQVFAHVTHRNSCDEHVYKLDALDLALWLQDIDNREEPVTYDFEPRSIAIGLPIGIINTIEDRLPRNRITNSATGIDWIRCILAEALGDMALAGPPVGKSYDPYYPSALTDEEVREGLTRFKAKARSKDATAAPQGG